MRRMLDALQCDNQTSVKHLLEWTIVLLLARQPLLINSLFIPTLSPVSHVTIPLMSCDMSCDLNRVQDLDYLVFHHYLQ